MYELTQLIQSLTRDESQVLTPDDIQQALELAVARYSKDKPRLMNTTVEAESAVLPLPDGWQTDFSHVVQAFAVPEQTELYIRQLPGNLLRLQSGYSGQVQLFFTGAHSLDSIENTLWAGDGELLACYAAAWCCEQLAAYYSNESNSTIAADVTDQQTKAEQYRKQAREYRRRYDSQINQGAGKEPAAGASGAVVSWGSRRRK